MKPSQAICTDCGAVLTDEEAHYYAGRCENCERAWHGSLKEWREGASNPLLDEMFGAPVETKH